MRSLKLYFPKMFIKLFVFADVFLSSYLHFNTGAFVQIVRASLVLVDCAFEPQQI